MTLQPRPRVLLATIAVVAALMTAACAGRADNSDPGYSVIVYGSDSCSICVALRGQMDEAEITYEYHDIRVDQAALNEAVAKISDQTWFDGTVRTPILEINGKMHERPTLAQVRRAIQAD